LIGGGRGRTFPPSFPIDNPPNMKLKFDKYRPQDPNLKHFNDQKALLEAQVAQSRMNDQRHHMDK